MQTFSNFSSQSDLTASASFEFSAKIEAFFTRLQTVAANKAGIHQSVKTKVKPY